MFHEHAREKYKPFAEENHIENSFTSTVSSNYMEWDGIHQPRGREFEWNKDIDPRGISFMQLDKRFYVYKKYNSMKNRNFLFSVMMAEEQKEAQNYRATIEIYHEASELSMSLSYPVLPLEDFPDYVDIEDCSRVWKIPYETMRDFFKVEQIDNENASVRQSKSWKVGYQ